VTGLKTLVSAWIACFVTTGYGADVINSEITGKGFVADFYCRRDDETNKLGVLFLGGAEGGKPNGSLAKLFAENGYPTLAVAYFKEKGLPESLQLIPLEYFDAPMEWMEHNKRMRPDGIVAVGASRGAELALLLASIKPAIKGVIALSPSSVVWFGLSKELPILPCSSWTHNGEPVPYIPYEPGTKIVPGDMEAIYRNIQDSLTDTDQVEKASIHVEQIQGPILLASGHDDKIWPSEEMGDAICSRLKVKGFKHQYEHVKCRDAGHTLGFGPQGMMGGTAEGNREARNQVTEKMLAFLKAYDSK